MWTLFVDKVMATITTEPECFNECLRVKVVDHRVFVQDEELLKKSLENAGLQVQRLQDKLLKSVSDSKFYGFYCRLESIGRGITYK